MFDLVEGCGFVPPKEPVKWFAVLTEPDERGRFWIRYGSRWALVAGARSWRVLRLIDHWDQRDAAA